MQNIFNPISHKYLVILSKRVFIGLIKILVSQKWLLRYKMITRNYFVSPPVRISLIHHFSS